MTDPQPDDAPELRDDDSAFADSFVDGVDSDDERADAAPAGGGRPPLIALIAGALLLVVLGAGLAIAFVPSRSAPAAPAASAPVAPAASAPAGATAPAAGLPTPSVPTALPLPQPIGDVTSTEAVATVGDVTITRGEFVRAYQPGAPPSDVLNQLIQVELVLQQAKAEGVTVDKAKIEDQIAQIKQENSIADDAAFLAFLQQKKILSLDELRGLLQRDQAVEHMLLTHTTVEQAHARRIVLAAAADKIDARKAEAEDLLKQIQGGADFAQLATQKSEDSISKDKGGDLGWLPRGLVEPEIDTAVFGMKKGELRLVKSQAGWYIIELLDLPEIRSLDSRDILNTPVGQQAFKDTFLPWVAKLKSDAETANKIKILVTDAQLVTQPGG